MRERTREIGFRKERENFVLSPIYREAEMGKKRRQNRESEREPTFGERERDRMMREREIE